jgi:hypothetical protein
MMSEQERIELNKTLPKRMNVWDDNSIYECERIVLLILPGKTNYPVIVVNKVDEFDFKNGMQYSTSNYKHCKEIPQVEEMTLEQVCKELGREIKIIK